MAKASVAVANTAVRSTTSPLELLDPLNIVQAASTRSKRGPRIADRLAGKRDSRLAPPAPGNVSRRFRSRERRNRLMAAIGIARSSAVETLHPTRRRRCSALEVSAVASYSVMKSWSRSRQGARARLPTWSATMTLLRFDE
jgi:hypothetical protein